ncbi:MAG: hypothetical protein GX275_02785 [Clostridiales bacterium]|nr:hypothetical protein [Clostridiales bacterium]
MVMVRKKDHLLDFLFNQDILGIILQNTNFLVYKVINNAFIPISKENIYSINISNSAILIKEYDDSLFYMVGAIKNIDLLITIEETINGNKITIYILEDKAINELVKSELAKESKIKEYYDKSMEITSTSYVKTSTGVFGYGLNNI